MSPKLLAAVPAILIPALMFAAGPARAAWPHQSGTNLPVCTAANNQTSASMIPDGAGGAIVTWQDSRGANFDIYAQHILGSGTVDPAWPASGRVLCAAANDQTSPKITGDGSGGAIVTWNDLRGVNYDIYAQHVLASGAVDPVWPADGRALCTAANAQAIPSLVTDGAGGAIVTWQDARGANFDIYAQHVLASGAVDPAWPADGRALCAAAGAQGGPMIVTDGAGGAIATWSDSRNVTPDIYAQHVLASGVVDAVWPVDGRAIVILGGNQLLPTIVEDGVGGAIVTWYDARLPANGFDIFASHLQASGALDPAWPVDGRGVCNAAVDQVAPMIIADGAGGAIITWYDNRTGGQSDIYAQHVLAAGSVDPAWPANGRALCTNAITQQNPVIAADGAGGAIVSWEDLRNGTTDIYAQHVMASGAVDPFWPVDGRALSTATGSQLGLAIVADGAGGAIMAWNDSRNGSGDLYAQRVARFGYLGTPEAEITGAKDIPNDQGGKLKLSWDASWLDLASDSNLAWYEIYRSVPPNVAAAAVVRGAQVLRSFAEVPAPGKAAVMMAEAQAYAWEYLATQNALHYIPSYSYLASTAEDSTGDQNPKTAFMIVARNAAGTTYWLSRPDSGYSADNLPPTTPAPFAGNYSGGATHLHWNPNPESDLAHYRLYRGSSAGFIPGPGNLIASPPDTGFADGGAAGSWYKLSAVDAHGNESGFALLSPGGTVDVADEAPASRLAFERPSPNPASARSTLRYSIPREGRVALLIYDTAGRLIRSLVDGTMPAGSHQEAWDLRADSGRPVDPGLYFVRLEVEGRSVVRRLLTIR